MSDYSHVTLLFCHPRSQSQWLAWFYGHAIEAWHDPLANCESIDELVAKIDARGTQAPLFIADTAALYFHRRLLTALPGARAVYVYRPLMDVWNSLQSRGFVPRTRDLKLADAVLRQKYDRTEYRAPYVLLGRYAYKWWSAITGGASMNLDYRQARATIIDSTPEQQRAKGDEVKFRRLWKTR